MLKGLALKAMLCTFVAVEFMNTIQKGQSKGGAA
jgi:hypothetical protein